MRSVPHRALLLMVVSLLLASPLLAADARVFRAEREPGIFSVLRQVVGTFVPALMKGRAGQDPNGSPLPDPSSAGPTTGSETEGRAGQDPNG